MKEFYKRKENITEYDLGDDGIVLFDPESKRTHLLNEVGIVIWNSCDGKTGREEILDIIMNKYDNCDKNLVQNDIETFLTSLSEKKLINKTGNADKDAKPNRHAADVPL
jgi:hypothetical protein